MARTKRSAEGKHRMRRSIHIRAFNAIIKNREDPNQNGILVSDILLYFRPRGPSLKTHWEHVLRRLKESGAVRSDETCRLMDGDNASKYFIDMTEVEFL